MVLLITKFLVRPRRTRSGNKKNKSNNQKDGKKGDGQKKKQGEGKKSGGYSHKTRTLGVIVVTAFTEPRIVPRRRK